MTYRELILQAEFKLDHNDITLGEFEQMIAPLNREVDVLDKIRAEIEILNPVDYVFMSPYEGRGASNMKDDVLQIIDKYREGEQK